MTHETDLPPVAADGGHSAGRRDLTGVLAGHSPSAAGAHPRDRDHLAPGMTGVPAAAVGGYSADQGDLTYRAAAADRAAKIAVLVGQVENLRAERTELERRVDKLEHRLKRAHDKLGHRTEEVRYLQTELDAVLAASTRPVLSGDRGSFTFRRFVAVLARKARLRA
jgi:hypothetical protein